ncbi:MAG: LysR family transcriptional regulator [Eubacteriales bacterium]|nr:LysR family transcriptional regulator [Eubacteriales bacterium]
MEQALSSYKVFFEVAKAGNISKAAKQLQISQPAISKSIVKLEEQVGVKLFNRNSRGVHLTAEGEVLFTHIEEAFSYIERGEDELKRIREFHIGHLRIGSSTTLCKYVLLPFLREYLKKNPHMKITIENQATAKTIQKIENHKLDVGVVVLSQFRHGMKFSRIMEVEDVFVCTPDYLKHLKEIAGESVDIFEQANLMLLDKENITRRHIDEYFRDHGIVPRQILEISTMDLLIEFAKIGMGVSAVIREFVLTELHEGTLVEIPLAAPIKKRVAGFAYQETNQNEALKSFLQSAR